MNWHRMLGIQRQYMLQYVDGPSERHFEDDKHDAARQAEHKAPLPRTVPFVLFLFACFSFIAILVGLGVAFALESSKYRRLYAPLSPASDDTAFPFGLPKDLPFVPYDRLINARELDLQTNFTSGIATGGTVRTYVLDIAHALAAPDGFAKPMILANGQSPGPLIEANVGDTVRVVVNNRMEATATSIHWHGISQQGTDGARGTPWMDGVVGVSQCAIPAGGSFVYDFEVAGQRGTFWWHAHAGVQYGDGLFGPIVIHDPDEMVPPVDDDKIIFVGDTYHTYGPMILNSYLNSTSKWSPEESGVEPLPDNILMDGQNVYNCSIPSSTYAPPPSTQTGNCTGGRLYTTKVKEGHRVRLRLINHSSFFSYWVSIDNHTLEIVEQDGIEIEPVTARGVYLNIGQRYSVVITANQTKGNYYIRATLPKSCFLPYSTYTNAGLDAPGVNYQARGVLSYDGVDVSEPPIGVAGNTTNPYGVENNLALAAELTNAREDGEKEGIVWEGCDDMPFDAAVPMRTVPAYDVSDDDVDHLYVEFVFRQAQDVNRIFINKTAYSPLTTNATLWKALEQDFSSAANSYNSWDFGLNQQVLLVPDTPDPASPNRGVQLVINSRDDMEHPWHLHGHTFQIVGWGHGAFGQGGSTTTWSSRMPTNPPRRDTVTVPGNGHVVLRFAADNPGVWALHCHVAWHVEGGMFVMIAERPAELKRLVADMDPETRRISQGFCAAAGTADS